VTPDSLPSLDLPSGNRREIFAWALYDWANSAYSTLSITILVYYLTKVVLPGRWGPVAWAWGISLSMLTAAVLSPILGAMADASANKRRWLAGTALAGAGAAVLLAAVPPEMTWLVITLFVLTALGFELSIGFYNGFLPEIADETTMNRISAFGYALGYIGGAAALGLAVLVQIFGSRIGLPELSDQLRVGLLILGLWWGGFTLPAIWVLRDRGKAPQQPVPWRRAVRRAVGEVRRSLGNVRQYRMLALFLLGFLFYNDGIQSVISQASTFAIMELKFETTELILLILLIQLVACPGATLVGRLADRIGQKAALHLCLAVWVGLIVTAFFIPNKTVFWFLGVLLALVLGGTQSVSRAIMGRMAPPGRTAEFFGFFNFSGKATSFLGTFLFGLIIAVTGSARWAVLSLLVFFLLGWAIVSRVDIQQGRRNAFGR